MKTKLLKAIIIISLLSLSSCVTLFSNKTYKLEVKGEENSKVKIYNIIYNLPTRVVVDRSKNELPIFLMVSDTIEKKYNLIPTLRPMFWYGNLIFGPAGYLIDLTNSKKFYYGNSILLNTDGTISKNKTSFSKLHSNIKEDLNDYFSREYPTKKGQINLLLSVPYINSFNFQPNGETRKNNTGFLGFSTGIEYYHSDNRFLSLNASAAIDFILPFPVVYDYEGEQEFLSSLSLSITENYKKNRFTFGYGINFSKNNYKLNNTYEYNINPNLYKPVFKSNYAIGLVGNCYFQLGKKFFIGLNYKPTFYKIKPSTQFQYEHLVSLDLMWKIKLKK